MYNITPIEYLASTAKTIVLSGTTKTGADNRYWIEITQINGLTFDCIEGRTMEVYKSGNNITSGVVRVEFQKTVDTGVSHQWLIFPDATYSTYRNSTVIAYGTFQIGKDNQAITLMDVYNCRAAVADIDPFGNIVYGGKPGIISGPDLTKIRYNLNRWYLLNNNLQLNNSNTELCRLRIRPGFLNQFRIVCASRDYTLNLDLRIRREGDGIYANTLRPESTGKDITVKFSAGVQKYTDGSEWAVLIWKSSDLIKSGFRLYVEIGNLEDTKPIGSASGNMINLTWNTAGDTTNGLGIGSLIEIPVTQELAYIDNKSIQFGIYIGETNHRHIAITAGTNLNSLIPGKNYYTPKRLDLSTLINLPSGVGEEFILECNKTELTDIRCTYILMTKTAKFFYGYLENNLIKWNTPALSDHTHAAASIVTDPNHRFVTDIWISSVNNQLNDIGQATSNNLWKSPAYPSRASLPSSGNVAGTNVIVTADETHGGKVINYLFNGSEWVPTSINALGIVTLTNGSGLMSSDMLKRLNAAEKQYMVQIGTNWQRLENTKSTHISGKNRVSDFVVRGSDLNNYSGGLGDDTIAFGTGRIFGGAKSFLFGEDINVGGTYQVAMGQGLRYSGSETNVSLFGRFNKADDTGMIFAYGVGTSDTARKNLIWGTKIGEEYFLNVYSGYRILNKGADDILLADGTTFSKATIPTYEEIMREVMAYLESVLSDESVDVVHFLDYSGKTYDILPIIQHRWKSAVKYFVESWAEFKSRIIELGTPKLGDTILFVGIPTSNDCIKYVYCNGGIIDADGNQTIQNTNWCNITNDVNNIETVSSLPAVGDVKSFEGNIVLLSEDNKIYRFNDGKIDGSSNHQWEYFSTGGVNVTSETEDN